MDAAVRTETRPARQGEAATAQGRLRREKIGYEHHGRSLGWRDPNSAPCDRAFPESSDALRRRKNPMHQRSRAPSRPAGEDGRRAAQDPMHQSLRPAPIAAHYGKQDPMHQNGPGRRPPAPTGAPRIEIHAS